MNPTPSLRHARLAAALAAGLALLGADARAQGTDPAAADALFQKAREAAEKGDWPAACPKFAESQRLDPAPGTLLNLADCEEHLNQTASAYQHFKAALETMPASDDRIGFARQRMSALEKGIPHLTLSPSPDLPPDAKVMRDDVVLGSASFGIAIPVNPGTHVISVTAPGRLEKRTTLTIKPGDVQSFTLTAGAVDTSPARASSPAVAVPASASPTPLTAHASPTVSKTTMGLVLSGVGVAGLAVGAVTGVLVLGKKSTVTDPAHCDQSTHACDAAGVQAASDGRTLSTISTVAFVAGAAAVGLGAYLVLSSRDDPPLGASASTASTTMVGASTMAGGAGLRMIHTF